MERIGLLGVRFSTAGRWSRDEIPGRGEPLLVCVTETPGDAKRLAKALNESWWEEEVKFRGAGGPADALHSEGFAGSRSRQDREAKRFDRFRGILEEAVRLAHDLGIRLLDAQRKPTPPPAEGGKGSQRQGNTPGADGYVTTPCDTSAYLAASDVLTMYMPPELSVSMKELSTIVEDYATNRVRWTRPKGKNGRPMKNRRSVHLGDWAAYLKRRTGTDADGFPQLSGDEIEHRKAAVRKSKHAGK